MTGTPAGVPADAMARLVDVEGWLHALAEELSRLAARDAAARAAFERFLATGP